ncbi:MAG: hypothetical protein K6356_06150 [Chloroflexus sp.]
MKRSNRALFALLPVLALLLLVGLMAAASPEPAPVANVVEVSPLDTPTAEPTATVTPSPLPSPTPTPTLARREFLETYEVKVAPTSFLPGRGPVLPGEFVYAGRRLDFYVGRATFSADQVRDLAVKVEYALGYLQRRFDVELTDRVSIGFYNPALAPTSDTRGIAYTHDRTVIHIFYGPREETYQALVIITHELAHALQAEAYGRDAQARADLILLEGLATWISGEYWLSLSESPPFQARARELYNAGYRGNLAALAGSANSMAAYEMWAGFVEYLARTYGWDKFNELYATGRGRAPGSANYRGIYGKSFQELYTEWYATLR